MGSMDLSVKFQWRVYHQLEAHHQLLAIIVMDTMVNLKRETLVTKELTKKFMDLLQTTNQSSLNHGEEWKRLTQLMVSSIPNGNGLINQLHWLKSNMVKVIYHGFQLMWMGQLCLSMELLIQIINGLQVNKKLHLHSKLILMWTPLLIGTICLWLS